MSAVQPYKMEDVQQRVAETIKAQFAMLIPDEAFDAMARAAIDEFYNTEKTFNIAEVRNPGGYSMNRYELQTAISPFKALMWNELRTLTREHLRAWIKEHVTDLNAEIEKLFADEASDTLLKSIANLDLRKLSLDMATRMHGDLLRNAAMGVEGRLLQFAGDNQLNYRPAGG